jgi:hypothetical protein
MERNGVATSTGKNAQTLTGREREAEIERVEEQQMGTYL